MADDKTVLLPDVASMHDAPPPYTPSGYGATEGHKHTVQPAGTFQPPIAHQVPPVITTTTVIASTSLVPRVIPVGKTPMSIICPNCGASVISMLSYNIGSFATLFAVIFCFLGIFIFIFGGLVFVWIPLVCNCFKDVMHNCPNCGHLLGYYKRL